MFPPPIQWRGGLITELYKNNGTSSKVDSERDIMLGDDSGKSLFGIIRKNIIIFSVLLYGYAVWVWF